MEKKDNSTITAVFNDIQYTFSPTFVGENIKKLETRKKISKNHIIDEWYEEISLDDVINWENGISLPPIDDLDYLAGIFDVSLEYLLSGKEKEKWNGWKYVSVEAEANKYINNELIIDELSNAAKDLLYKLGKITPDDEYDDYLNGNKDILELSKEAKAIAYKYGVDVEDEVKDYRAGNRKYEELGFWAKMQVDDEDEENVDAEDLSDDEQVELFENYEIEFFELSDTAKEIAIERMDESQQIDLYNSGEIEISQLTSNAKTELIESLSPEEQFALLDDGDIEFNEMTDEAQTLFYEINED